MTILLTILVGFILLGVVCVVWMLVWSMFEETELGATIIDKIKYRKDGKDEW